MNKLFYLNKKLFFLNNKFNFKLNNSLIVKLLLLIQS